MKEKKIFHVALVGNPNCGKSTLFNRLTGARQRIGNYPGVTVERVEGTAEFQGNLIRFLDLPGTYCLNEGSAEERIVFDTLRSEPPDLVLNILDTSNLERNLQLTLELAEAGLPLMLVFNMTDIAERRGWCVDAEKIAGKLGVPFVRTVGNRRAEARRLLEKVSGILEARCGAAHRAGETDLLDFGPPDINPAPENNGNSTKHNKLAPTKTVCSGCGYETFAGERLRKIAELCDGALTQKNAGRSSASDRWDVLLTHRYFGLPLFFVMMYVVFQMTFTLGEFPMRGIEWGMEALSAGVDRFFIDAPDSLLRSFFVDGVIGGVGGVLVFLPNILFLFLALSLLEDSGYMARAAFLMNRFLKKIGLPGTSCIPLLIGFGCSVPAILATRTLSDRRARLTTIFIIPLMSCGARLPIYALLIPAFFPPAWRAPMLWLIYTAGILLAILCAKILRGTLFRGGDSALMLELPAYHCPTLQTVGTQTLFRAWLYLKKAGTVILALSIILWAMTTFPKLSREETARYDALRLDLSARRTLAPDAEKAAEIQASLDNAERRCREAELEQSLIGRLGRALEPALRPMGCDAKIGTALLGAFAAKEVFVAQLGIVFRVGGNAEDSDSLRETLARNYSPLTGLCVLIFCLVGMPCMATLAVVAREVSWRFAMVQWMTLTLLAWLLAAGVSQIGALFG